MKKSFWAIGALALGFCLTVSSAARAEIVGRQFAVERLQAALRRNLTADELKSFKDATEAAADDYRAERRRMAQTIVDATGVETDVVNVLLPPLGTSRTDADPRLVTQLGTALNRPLGRGEERKVLKANADNVKACRRIRRAYLDRVRKIVHVPYERLRDVVPEFVG